MYEKRDGRRPEKASRTLWRVVYVSCGRVRALRGHAPAGGMRVIHSVAVHLRSRRIAFPGTLGEFARCILRYYARSITRGIRLIVEGTLI